ncbi:MAG TPA: type II toxin-antitoxin system HicB family antitoxin [Dehalococcoidia bacterium]|nr:type II toxin-antitoxin system HicB family antitoxin [Dehalococcoidia bacterium]
MKKYKLNVEVEPLGDGPYLAVASNLRGCLAEGDTIAEALENIEDVARIIIELCIREGLPLPPELRDEDEPPIVKGEVVVKVGAWSMAS